VSGAPLRHRLLALAVIAAPAAAPADVPPPCAPCAETARSEGSLATFAPLGEGRTAMLLGGGVAVLLPFYEIEIGYGISPRVDLVGRFQTVAGLFHDPSVGVRWSPADLGRFRLGVDGGVHYSFLGIATDQMNLASTLYLTGEIGISGPISRSTDLYFGVDNEIDLLHQKRVKGRSTFEGAFHYDAALFGLGIRTRLTEDLDGLLRARLRVPVETFTYKATGFYVMPFLEVGGTWAW
jgi:hypothetical protein